MKKSMKCLSVVLAVMLTFGIIPFTEPSDFVKVVYAAEDAAEEETCDHDWSEWEVEEEPTCVDEGTKTRFCYICDEEQSKTIKATGKHDWDSWEVTKEPTVRKEGRKVRECLLCEKTQKKSIKKLKPFAKISRKSLSIKAGRTKTLSVKYAAGDKVKKWKSRKPSVASVNKKGQVTAKKAGTTKITVLLKSGKKASCTVKVTQVRKKSIKKSSTRNTSDNSSGGTVYWTPSGSVYHKSRNCPTLSRSRVIKSGTVSQSRKKRVCKVCG